MTNYFTLIQCTSKLIINKHSVFKGPPYRNCNVQVLYFQRGPQQQLQIEGNLFSNAAPRATEMCKYTCFQTSLKESLKETAMCKFSVYKGEPNSNFTM